ncbi:uncharacterized protein LOC124370165 [Homalodisca vitripennis]|uniref:uncharacterized protein LOC124370165 n=1 Tax=Homalodisca vitripennis TaxID=197043 RepID=UPI001EEBD393|nr:uncharacterized protein LOC124370165 [Homalodisca vitripennis]
MSLSEESAEGSDNEPVLNQSVLENEEDNGQDIRGNETHVKRAFPTPSRSAANRLHSCCLHCAVAAEPQAVLQQNFKKNDAWEAIATQLETTSDTVKSKITYLLASFRREKNKEETSKGTGKGADEIYRSKWFAYEAFGFLKDKNKCKETINSCTSQNASKENDSQVELIQEEDDNTSESASQITQTLPHQQSQEIRSASSQTALGFAKPTPMKRKRTPASPRSQVDEVVGILHNAVRRDACDVYGEHVAMKLKSYSKRTQAFVQHHVNNILFEADMGRYDELPHQNRRFISSVFAELFSLSVPCYYVFVSEFWPTFSGYFTTSTTDYTRVQWGLYFTSVLSSYIPPSRTSTPHHRPFTSIKQ